MRKTRILVVSDNMDLEEEPDEEIESPERTTGTIRGGKKVATVFEPLSLLDYNILVVDLVSIDLRSAFVLLRGFRGEFTDFFDGGGVLLVLSTSSSRYYRCFNSYERPSGPEILRLNRKYLTYTWFPVKLDIVNKEGKAVIFSSSKAIGRTLKDEDFVWKCVFETDLPHDSIATNPSGRIVGMEIQVSEGHIVLLPTYKDAHSRHKIVRNVLDVISRDYLGKKQKEILRPKWTSEYVIAGEKQAASRLEEAQMEMSKFKSAKGLLYLYNRELIDSICKVLEDIGYETRNLEMEGKHDVEITHGKSFGLLEGKGLKGSAKATHLRQLMDHYSEDVEEREEKGDKTKVKGIFVVNHFREKHPDKRGEPFTREATKIGERFGFCLMTTTQLHQMYSDFISGKLKLKDIHERIWETEGVLKDQ